MSFIPDSNSRQRPGVATLTWTWGILMGFALLNTYLAENCLQGTALLRTVLLASFVKLLLVAGSFMELWITSRGYFYMAATLFAVTFGWIAFAW